MVAEVSQPTIECPEPQRWRCFDAQSAEVEVVEFMAQLVKTTKPNLVVETGTHRGISAFYMGRALKENRRGRLITCEIDPKLYATACEFIAKGDMADIIDCRQESSLEMNVEGHIDILFTDSEPWLRVQEISRWWDQLDTTSLIVTHDVNTGIHIGLRKEMLAQDAGGQLSVVLLPTPRGLAICQKREGRT